MLPIGIEALREINESQTAAAALAARRRGGICVHAIDTAHTAGRRNGDRRGNDLETPHRNLIGRRDKNGAAG